MERRSKRRERGRQRDAWGHPMHRFGQRRQPGTKFMGVIVKLTVSAKYGAT